MKNNCFLCCSVVVIKEPIPPEVDLGFVISAGSTDATATLQQIKDVIKSFIDKYATYRLRYGIVSYGSTPRVELTLRDSLNPDVTQQVDAILRPGGTPDLAKALQLGEQLLSSARPNAQRVLVIITDVKSGSSPSKVKLVAKSLVNKDIRVFAVSVGKEADRTELITASGSGKNIINSSNTDEPGKVREEIMERIRQGKCREMFLVLLCPHLTFIVQKICTMPMCGQKFIVIRHPHIADILRYP